MIYICIYIFFLIFISVCVNATLTTCTYAETLQQHATIHCYTLQHPATHRSTLQHTQSKARLKHKKKTLQHTATHRLTMQGAATHATRYTKTLQRRYTKTLHKDVTQRRYTKKWLCVYTHSLSLKHKPPSPPHTPQIHRDAARRVCTHTHTHIFSPSLSFSLSLSLSFSLSHTHTLSISLSHTHTHTHTHIHTHTTATTRLCRAFTKAFVSSFRWTTNSRNVWILQSLLTTQFTINNDDKADFCEFPAGVRACFQIVHVKEGDIVLAKEDYW